MNLISRTEEIILLTILKLEGNAYGFSIWEQIFNDSGEKWSFASIYRPLSNLTRKAYVKKIEAEVPPKRKGKKKFLYQLTPEGRKALKCMHDRQEKFWANVSDYVID